MGNVFNNPKNGEVITYYDNGNIKSIKNYKNDVLEGEYKLFYNNEENTLKTSTTYINGKVCGNESTYYKNGQLYETMEGINGYLNGPYITYNEDGSLKSNEMYSCDLEHGLTILYDKNVRREFNYEYGVPCGTHSKYIDDVKVMSVEYVNGKPDITTLIEYDKLNPTSEEKVDAVSKTFNELEIEESTDSEFVKV